MHVTFDVAFRNAAWDIIVSVIVSVVFIWIAGVTRALVRGWKEEGDYCLGIELSLAGMASVLIATAKVFRRTLQMPNATADDLRQALLHSNWFFVALLFAMVAVFALTEFHRNHVMKHDNDGNNAEKHAQPANEEHLKARKTLFYVSNAAGMFIMALAESVADTWHETNQ